MLAGLAWAGQGADLHTGQAQICVSSNPRRPVRPIERLIHQHFENHASRLPNPLTHSKIVAAKVAHEHSQWEGQLMNGNAVLENVRRYRAIASLYRQTAVFCPPRRPSLLEQARAWEERAIAELEAHFASRGSRVSALRAWMVQAATGPMLNAA